MAGVRRPHGGEGPAAAVNRAPEGAPRRTGRARSPPPRRQSGGRHAPAAPARGARTRVRRTGRGARPAGRRRGRRRVTPSTSLGTSHSTALRPSVDFNDLTVDDVSRHFGRRRAVSHITFQAPRGVVLGLLGPN